ncbi:MAG: hypothetical protein ABR592_14430 [Nitriliruptorales bacterium]
MHHANQYLVTTGYDDREGIDELVAGYAAVLRLHEERQVPANLHISGTLIEAAAWHAPWFLELIGRLHAAGLVELVGGTYADGIMTVLPQTLNRRSILEHLALCRRHFSCDPGNIATFWVPERVWETSSLASILTSPQLPNGGFRAVLIDDRLFYPSSPSGDVPHRGSEEPSSPRRRFDAAGPYQYRQNLIPHAPDLPAPGLVAGAQDLVAVPISSWLRYCIPPRSREDWHLLQRIVTSAYAQVHPPLLVYADDLERTAGLASWERHALPAYAEFLDWLIRNERLVPVRLTSWLDAHPARHVITAEAGTFFELARRGAGEDYRGWWDAQAWAPYRSHLGDAEEAIRSAARDGVDGALVELAWKHLLASTYETAWHSETSPAHRMAEPAPWARATASHARSCLPMLAAARSFSATHQPRADLVDLDGDGEKEAALSNGLLYAVLSPPRGGRLTALFAATPAGGAEVIGNPSDDWNWQEELHAYMERPPNHPGALSDVGFEHDLHEVAAASTSAAGASLELVNVDPASPLNGTRKGVLLPTGREELVVCYRWPPGVTGLAVDFCLSPDYLRLLREGRGCLVSEGDERRRGARAGNVAVSVRLAFDEATSWVEPNHQVGHGIVFRVRSHTSHFHLVIACGGVAAAGTEPYCLDDAVAHFGGALPACRGG